MRALHALCCVGLAVLAMPADGAEPDPGINVSFQVHGVDWFNVSHITFANYSVFVAQKLLTYDIDTTKLDMIQVYFTVLLPNMLNASWIRFNNGPVFVRVLEKVQVQAVRNPNTLVMIEVPGVSWQAFSLQEAMRFLHGTVRNSTLENTVMVRPVCPEGQFLPENASQCQLCSSAGAEQYVWRACTPTSDAVFHPCTSCGVLQYEACPCSIARGPPPCLTGNRLCLPMATPGCPAGFYADNRSRCLPNPCPPGSTGHPLACTPCSPGTYKNVSGNFSCLGCSSGRFSSANASVCAACNAGWYAKGPRATGCLACSRGTYSKGSAGACTACPWNTYAPFANASSCQSCSPASFSNGTGRSACVFCRSGEGLNSAGRACEPCAPGTYGQAGSCLDCASGTYSTGAGAIGAGVCRRCASGKFTLTRRATVCFPCLPGTYGEGCVDCPRGTYQPRDGATSCVRCMPGQYTTSVGGTSELACLNCELGTYYDGNGTCVACPPYTVSPAGALMAGECRSMPGYFARRQGETPEICPPDHFCPLGTTHPAPCPHGLTSESGSSACSIPTHSVLLFEIIVIIIWAILFVLALWYYVHSRLRKEEQTRTASVIRLRLMQGRS